MVGSLTNYLSALDYPNEDDNLYKNFSWPADLHIIGKDILRFHAVYWPAFLLAAGINPPKKFMDMVGFCLVIKKCLNQGNILDPLEIIDIYGLDPLRYYLIKRSLFCNDGNISREKLEIA